MAQDVLLDIAAGPSITWPTGNVTAGNGDTTTSADLGATPPMEISCMFIASIGSGTVDGTLDLYVLWSGNDTDFADTPGVAIGSMTPVASSTVKKLFNIRVLNRYLKIYTLNNQTSGPQLNSTGSSVTTYDVAVNQA